MLKKLLLLAVSCLLSVVLLEGALRVGYERRFGTAPTEPDEGQFWARHELLGWAPRPAAADTYTNGAFAGRVTFDEHGVRLNAETDTRRAECRNVFFIGDSTTASLEVDNDETVPAVFETLARERGICVNAVNLGVRGYGTDQSVLRAVEHASRYPPTDIVYLFVENDVFNNNTLRREGRRYGKGAFIRSTAGSFEPHNIPVPDYREGETGLVVLDDECQPIVHMHTAAAGALATATVEVTAPRSARFNRWLKERSYLMRAAYAVKRSRTVPRPETIDPFVLVRRDPTWSWDYRFGYQENGGMRRRCGGYYEDQMSALLGKLREIRSAPRIHVVTFPDPRLVEDARAGVRLPSVEQFDALVATGAIDSFVDLISEMSVQEQSPRDLECPYDRHFCEAGCNWIAGELAGRLLEAIDRP